MLLKTLGIGLILATSVGFATVAESGVCPRDQVLAKPRKLKVATTMAVEQEVLSQVDLNGWRGVNGLDLRMGRLVVKAGGQLAKHLHIDRPAIMHVLDGELIEHNSVCAVPIIHVAGDSIPEFGEAYAHWWENRTNKPVTVFVSDLVPTNTLGNEPDM